MRTFTSAILLSALLLGCTHHRYASDPAKETPAQREDRMEWFREARFGMFIHFGLYAVPGGEWNGQKVPGIGEWIMNNGRIPVADYEKLASQFNPSKFSGKEWVAIAKNAGMKYIVITSKHHDGFALFDSKVSNYTLAKASPFKRDLLKELADAAHAEGITICWYHSIMDWHHPDAQSIGYPDYNNSKSNPNFPRYVQNYLKPQVKELLTNYGNIGIMWFDGEWIADWKPQMGNDMNAFCRSLQPSVIVNNRVGKARSGMGGMSQGAGAAGDYGTPEQEIPPTGFPGMDWESCMTMNDTWGFKNDDHNWKSATTIIRMLIDCASKGGNLLLNVGHVFNSPANNTLLVPMTATVSKAYLLADPSKSLTASATDQGIQIKLPADARDPHATVVVVEYKGKFQSLATGLKQAPDGSITLAAPDATLHDVRLEEKGGAPNIGYWITAQGFAEWDVQITTPGTFNVELTAACPDQSSGNEYEIEAGKNKLAGKVVGTRSWDDFVVFKIGSLKIDAPGPLKITLKAPKKDPATQGVMNIRKIVLTPV
ncbi:MAG: alpha-L-fucosidase [Planctomycetota bacterium]|nr:alpha-L-fucosidase [Planctomycetota bacterium]